jgi:hypothetical protein
MGYGLLLFDHTRPCTGADVDAFRSVQPYVSTTTEPQQRMHWGSTCQHVTAPAEVRINATIARACLAPNENCSDRIVIAHHSQRSAAGLEASGVAMCHTVRRRVRWTVSHLWYSRCT